MAVDLRHLRSFVVVAEEGNVGRAARRMFITQPALSRQLKQLEDELGVMLLVRVPRGVELTDAGRELLHKARSALEAAEQAMTIGRPAAPAGRLVVGVTLAGHREHWFGVRTGRQRDRRERRHRRRAGQDELSSPPKLTLPLERARACARST